MSDPKRYEIGVSFIAPVFVPVETEVGDWVRYVDYAILRSVAEDNKRECEATRIENARLKAEVYELKKEIGFITVRQSPQIINLLEIERLKAEVERLTALNKKIMATADVIDANNQRLTKAGDSMSDQLLCDYGDNPLTYAWHAAKEGKDQS